MNSTTLVGLMPAPAGVVPDFDIHHMTDTQLSFILAYGITLGLATITLGLRIYTRIFIVHSLGFDDVVLLLAMGFSAGFFYICVDMMKYGFGRHLWEVTLVQLESYLNLVTPLVATYAWAPAFTKLSIILLIHRLNPNKWLHAALYATAFMIIAYTLTITLVIAYPCTPRVATNAECLNNCGLWQAILNIITDVIILILPMHMLYHLNIPLRQKMVLAGVFSTGVFVIVICIVRITYIMSLQNNPDVTYTQGRAAVWSSVEINIGIFCNTVVVLKPFMRQLFPTFFNSYAAASGDRITPVKPRSGVFGALSGNRDNQGYQLSSMENRVEVGRANSRWDGGKNDKGIVVTSSYKIDSSKGGDSESTEDIIARSKAYDYKPELERTR